VERRRQRQMCIRDSYKRNLGRLSVIRIIRFEY
jgi:hypothetical protein